MRHLRQENPRPAACVNGNWQTCTVTLDQIAYLPTTQAVAATNLSRRIGSADALGGQQTVLAHHKLGTVGVDRTQDAGFSSQFGNTLRIIAEQLGRQVHPPRTEFAQLGKRSPIRAEHRRRHVKRHAQLASDHHLSQVAADDAPGTLHQ